MKNMKNTLDSIDYSKALRKFAGSPCLNACVHRTFNDDTETFECPAFPDGIPEDITAGQNRHNAVDKRQTGALVYKRR
jgi:hypothetical protein